VIVFALGIDASQSFVGVIAVENTVDMSADDLSFFRQRVKQLLQPIQTYSIYVTSCVSSVNYVFTVNCNFCFRLCLQSCLDATDAISSLSIFQWCVIFVLPSAILFTYVFIPVLLSGGFP